MLDNLARVPENISLTFKDDRWWTKEQFSRYRCPIPWGACCLCRLSNNFWSWFFTTAATAKKKRSLCLWVAFQSLIFLCYNLPSRSLRWRSLAWKISALELSRAYAEAGDKFPDFIYAGSPTPPVSFHLIHRQPSSPSPSRTPPKKNAPSSVLPLVVGFLVLDFCSGYHSGTVQLLFIIIYYYLFPFYLNIDIHMCFFLVFESACYPFLFYFSGSTPRVTMMDSSWSSHRGFRHKHTGITGHSHFRRTGAEAHLFTHSSRLYRCLSHSVTFRLPIIIPFTLLTVVLCFLDSP